MNTHGCQMRNCQQLPNHLENEVSKCPSSRLQDKYHPFNGNLHSKEEERLEDNFWVLTLASGRKEEPDLETSSLQWQLEVETGENSAERSEEEQTLRHLRRSTGVEEDGGNHPLRCDPKQEMMKRKQPETKQETTQEAICHGAAFSPHPSGGAWLRQVCGWVRGPGKTLADYGDGIKLRRRIK
ncbi:hypothetical protein NDU88_004866 [Pleurodeles waltl]|uniref:Uncharacterized protein n=1 Tax=Pleurodeles waltl TaxID=8319 RepID=A0AAV7VHG6_PLEWA|nr:hypothetical protein NDU88_004866 [Pleurodeles waltl]